MVKYKQFKYNLIAPMLGKMEMGGHAATNLLFGTALVESGLDYFVQHPVSHAISYFQIERATYSDLYNSYLKYRKPLLKRYLDILQLTKWPEYEKLLYRLDLSIMCARLIYYRAPAELPDAANVLAMAKYWKRYYNTHLGKGCPEDFINKYRDI